MEKLIRERDELKERIENLETFCGGENFPKATLEEQHRLTRQSAAMESYLQVLNERIKAITNAR